MTDSEQFLYELNQSISPTYRALLQAESLRRWIQRLLIENEEFAISTAKGYLAQINSFCEFAGKRFVISGENIEDYRKLGTIYFRNQQLEKMMSKDTAMIAEAKTSKIFAAVSALVQEGKLGEDFANIDESDPRAKDILENFRQLMEMLEKTEGTPEQARVEEKIKVLMDSKVYKNAKSLADTMLPTTESTPSKNAP